jgi:hypothetical protein
MEFVGKHTLFRHSYGWLLAGASAAALLIGLWLGVWHRPLGTPQKATDQQIAGNVRTRPAPKIIPAPRPRHRGTKLPLRKQDNGASGIELARGPRLDHFPSPRPLSQQEVLLARYAQHFPTEAVLIAQQQDKFQQGIEQAEQEAKNASSDSQHQER